MGSEGSPHKVLAPSPSLTRPRQKKPVKRPRTSRPTAQKHEKFWVLDGHVVLEAGGVLFRLHRSQLVDQSILFADVFDRGADVDEEYRNEVDMVDGEGGLVCRLKTVTAVDLQALLEYDRHPTQFYFAKPTLSALASILRAATSLQFTHYRAVAIKFLEEEWSTSLDDITEEYKPGALEVAALGRKCGVPGVLKRAFYEMTRRSGYGLGGDDECMEVDSEGEEVVEGKEEITRSDERLIERLREHLVLAWAQNTARLDPSFKCPYQAKRGSGKATQIHSPKCTSMNAKREAWDRLVHESGIYQDYLFDPIAGLQRLLEIDWEAEGWCEECVRMRKEAWSKARQRLWDRVNVWMGVDG
ncbi:hypothetical protein BU15DRAFT_51974 [Melanogaster broomeanus]|nr:hypothetical protein BU15DRAFT_51974 [Melanogaster broomeanus]